MTPDHTGKDFIEEFNKTLDTMLTWMAWLILFAILVRCGFASYYTEIKR